MLNARLLLVEDNQEIAQMMTLFLAARGFKVSVAGDAATALSLVREALPDLMLLDIGLPDINGLELLQRLRQAPRTRHLPIIVVTQRKLKTDRLAGLQMGADDFITKPFDPEELALRVQNLVARATRDNLINPQTSLPDRKITLEEVTAARLQPGRAILQFRLRHAADFRDLYGALAHADLMRHTALTMNRALNELGGADDFLGQQDDETFILIVAKDKAGPLCQTISTRFDQEAPQHYALAERQGEELKVRDSAGRERLVPLVKFEISAL